jgi:hypothetical protein
MFILIYFIFTLKITIFLFAIKLQTINKLKKNCYLIANKKIVIFNVKIKYIKMNILIFTFKHTEEINYLNVMKKIVNKNALENQI